jgi:alpha-D-xyloside xylohydrolase
MPVNEEINWDFVNARLNYKQIAVEPTYLCRWESYERTPSGLLFHARLANDEPVDLRIDVVQPDVVRLRLNPQGEGTSEILVEHPLPTAPFTLTEHGGFLEVKTERLRLTFQRYPWQMEVYAAEAPEGTPPFYSQRIDDRAYGEAYEVYPMGFGPGLDGQRSTRESVAVQPGEAFYGFGEKFAPFDRWKQEIVSWAVDVGNVSSHRSYKNVPFFMSTAGYGVFVHSSSPIVYKMGTESSISYSFNVLDESLDYFLIYGPTFKEILYRYTELTGRAPVPPKWSFGFWISRCGYKCREDVERVVRGMRERGFPCDVISLDPWWMGDGPWTTFEWDRESFPDPEGMQARLREQGVRTCLWISPYVTAGSRAFEEGVEKGYFVQRPEGGFSPVLEAFTGNELAAVDFTNPEAQAWFQSQLQRLIDMGAAVFKTDFGEQAPVDALYHDGRTGVEMHNLYPLLYNGAAFELTERNFGRGLTWGRSGYAGSQRYPVQWGGDSYSSLDQLSCQLRALLGYGMSGVPFCSHDVGGFDYSPAAFDTNDLESFPKDAEVYVRWLQFGTFSSHLRAHGKQPREPWTYGEEVEAIAHRYLNLRYRLLPYLYTEAVNASKTALPMVRPLVLEYQDDPTTERVDLEYLFGDAFLVAPVVTPAKRRQVYLPHGSWFDYWTKERVPGGRWLEVEAPLETLPLWVKAGAILPMGPEMAYVDERPLDPLTLELYLDESVPESELLIHDEARPAIAARYRREGQALTVEVDATAGAVEIVLYGVKATAARQGEEALALESVLGGQRVRVDGRRGSALVFELEEAA